VTRVSQSTECMKRFVEDFRKGLFTIDDGKVLKAWNVEMETFGPKHIESSSNWRDHALHGEWEGYRASCFSSSGRIIYRVIDKENIEVCIVERVTPNHDYRR
jgi:mRNA-degrading endonuclease YafQ of YafQ-DinJ toxin-antitoxin module